MILIVRKKPVVVEALQWTGDNWLERRLTEAIERGEISEREANEEMRNMEEGEER